MLKKYFVTLNSVFGLPKFYKKVEVLTNQQKNTFNIVIDGKKLKSASKYIIDSKQIINKNPNLNEFQFKN